MNIPKAMATNPIQVLMPTMPAGARNPVTLGNSANGGDTPCVVPAKAGTHGVSSL